LFSSFSSFFWGGKKRKKKRNVNAAHLFLLSFSSKETFRKMLPFKALLTALEKMAPLSLAGSWDNVGLLIAHVHPFESAHPYKVLLTNDITMGVLEESLTCFEGGSANMIISYHPTPFSALKKFNMSNPASRVVMTAAANNIAVFSPHTSWDAAPDMLNDWLLSGVVTESGAKLNSFGISPVKRAAGPLGEAGAGDGRMATLEQSVPLSQIIAGVKRHLNLRTVGVSLPTPHAFGASEDPATVLAAASEIPISSLAVCAGSGASVLGGLSTVSVWITGELSHHELLAASAAGVSVILTNHSNSERGFLPVAMKKLELLTAKDSIRFLISQKDADPLSTV